MLAILLRLSNQNKYDPCGLQFELDVICTISYVEIKSGPGNVKLKEYKLNLNLHQVKTSCVVIKF